MKFTNSQLTGLLLLRILIGWHFLYEGIAKIINPYWSSAGYLLESKWLLSGFFHSLAENASILSVVDFLNQWGLVAIGFGLIAGLLSGFASCAGIVLLLLYYIAQPALIGFESSIPTEGSYLIVNKNLIEAAALLVLALFPTGQIVGLDRLIFRKATSNRKT